MLKQWDPGIERKGARRDFEDFPLGAQIIMRRGLTYNCWRFIIAEGEKPDKAKPLKGIDVGVFEIALLHFGEVYPLIYAVQIEEAVWVIHAFQKKSKTGIKTPQKEIDLIKDRLKRLKDTLKWQMRT